MKILTIILTDINEQSLKDYSEKFSFLDDYKKIMTHVKMQENDMIKEKLDFLVKANTPWLGDVIKYFLLCHLEEKEKDDNIQS